MAALRAAASGYDAGDTWQAKHLASIIYILLAEGAGNTKALIGMTGHSRGLRLYSTVERLFPPSQPGEIVFRTSAPSMLTHYFDGKGGVKYEPALEPNKINPKRWLAFRAWWNENIFDDDVQFKMSRKNAVFFVRSRDGGSHVDKKLRDPDYASFSRQGDPLFKIPKGGALSTEPGGSPLKYGNRAIIRQIAWEVDYSLAKIGL